MLNEVMIIGTGSVGSTIAYAMMIKGICREIYLVDRNRQKARGEALDLSHGRAYVSPIEMKVGDYSDCSHVNVIVITAGAKQNPGETRIDLLNRNIGIMRSIIVSIEENRGDNEPILLIVSNPVDILTYFAYKFSTLPKTKVIGSGTALDTSRLRYEISNHCQIDARSIHGYIIGEHGDSEVALWSSLSIGNVLFDNFCEKCRKDCMGDVKKDIFEKVKNAAYFLIESKGYTNFGVGLATARICEAIVKNQHSVLPVSTILDGEYGLSNLAISLPCIIDSLGISRVLKTSMDEQEKEKFLVSAEKLRKVIGRLE